MTLPRPVLSDGTIANMAAIMEELHKLSPEAQVHVMFAYGRALSDEEQDALLRDKAFFDWVCARSDEIIRVDESGDGP